jgi:hypothetical protein
MMPGRAHRDESVVGAPRHHFIHRKERAAGGAQSRLEAAGRERGVGVDPRHALLRRRRADGFDVIHRMTERDGLERRGRRLRARQRGEFRPGQDLVDRTQPVRPLGVPQRRQMIEAGGMGDEQGRHGASTTGTALVQTLADTLY